jgi:peptidoglycan/LPS O-acetylase OafA/YrhL
VIATHTFGSPKGGFVGVDIFFVLSGFLITGLLIREYETTSRISWAGFYRRRIKRIVPAAVLVLGATVLFAPVVFNELRARSTFVDSLCALLFGANWRYMSQATDYFAADGPVSPLQHYWSLSIEEQFYFVWPWLMLGVFSLVVGKTIRFGSAARVAAGLSIGFISVLSFAYGVFETSVSPASAYFSSFTRVWELGVGATLAAAAPLCARIPDRARPTLAWLGIVAMLTSMMVIDGKHLFPAPAAAWPVLATALVVAAGTGVKQQRYLWPVTSRGAQYVGDISYSLYLWHFPILILGTSWLGESSATKVELLCTMLLVSSLAYHLIEDPIRRSNWLSGGSRSTDGLVVRIFGPRRRQAAWLAVVVLTQAGFVGYMIDRNDRTAEAASAAEEIAPTDSATPAPIGEFAGPVGAALNAEIALALQATGWPSGLSPSMTDAAAAPTAPSDIQACAGAAGQPNGPNDCIWGSGDHIAVLAGDSIALAYSKPLRELFRSQGWRFAFRGTFGCAFVDLGSKSPDAGERSRCERVKRETVSDLAALKPDLLLLANLPSSYPAAEWHAGAVRMVGQVSASVGKVVYIASPPMAPDPKECFTPTSTPADCVGKPVQSWFDMADSQEQVAEQFKGAWVNTLDLFCSGGECPSFVGTTPVRKDGVHINQVYGMKILDALAEMLVAAGVIDTSPGG